MSGPITPAMTAEEWDEALSWKYGVKDYIVRPAEMIGFGEDSPSDLHRVAALALHNQPFGFTQKDVAALMYAAKDLRDAAPDVDDWDAMLATASRLHCLANRIHALLPPKAK